MDKLIEKIVNCFKNHLFLLNCGIVNNKYKLLYDAILLVKENINDTKLIEYYYNNLICSCTIKFIPNERIDDMLGFTLNDGNISINNFTWNEIVSNELKVYTITTNSVEGYNYLYFLIQEDVDFTIKDSLNNLLFDSRISELNQSFEFIGTTTTSLGKNNRIYRKKNMYNSINEVNFYVKLF